jgi:AraC-like DNA-binding protein
VIFLDFYLYCRYNALAVDFYNILNLLVFASSYTLIMIGFGSLFEKRNKAETFIIFFIFIFWGLDSLFLLSEQISFYKYYPRLLYINQPFELFIGPLTYYLYRILLEGKMRFERLTLILFAPGVFAILFFIPFFLQSPDMKLASIGFHNIDNVIIRSIYLFIMYSPGPFCIFCLILLTIHERKILSERGIRLLKQKKVLLIYNLLWIVIVFTGYVSILLNQSFIIKSTIFFANSIIILFYFLNKRHADFFLMMHKDASEIRYKRSMLKGINTDTVIERLNEFMEIENIYTDENLSLRSLSSMLEITPHQLSEILNTGLNTNFKNLVNAYRIDKVKKLLLENTDESILAIAYSCGFNSKTGFNTTFIKMTGMTPREFKKKKCKNSF